MRTLEHLKLALESLGIAGTSLTVLVVAGCLVGLWFILKNRISAAVKAAFDEKLEDIKNQNAINLEAIKTEYQRQIKDYEVQLKIRGEAAKIAELLAYADANKNGKIDQEKFNAMAWQLTLFLPRKIVCDMAQHFVHGKPTLNELLVITRKHLLNEEEDQLAAENIIRMGKKPGA